MASEIHADHGRRIGVYAGEGAQAASVETVLGLIARYGCGETAAIAARDCLPEILRGFDLLVLPGGRGSRICRALGEAGRRAVREFVARGGGVLGICAGFYALNAGPSWTLKLLPVKTVDAAHWRRGVHRLRIRFTPAGLTIFAPPLEVMEVYFENGPVVTPCPASGGLPTATTLATFVDDVAHPKGVKGVMHASPAVLTAGFGKGRVMGISPHFEELEETASLLARAVGSLTTTSPTAPGAASGHGVVGSRELSPETSSRREAAT